MEYGILIATSAFAGVQIVGSVASVDEASELIQNYIAAGPECNWLAPDQFEIHRRGANGGYTTIEVIAL